jgi:hypothetical protein
MWLWPHVQNWSIIQSMSDSTFGKIGLCSAAILFMSLLCVQNGLVSGTNWKFLVPYGLGCFGLVVSFAKQYNAGGLVLNSAFVFLMAYGIWENNIRNKNVRKTA